jgi:hypothetical protein
MLEQYVPDYGILALLLLKWIIRKNYENILAEKYGKLK